MFGPPFFPSPSPSCWALRLNVSPDIIFPPPPFQQPFFSHSLIFLSNLCCCISLQVLLPNSLLRGIHFRPSSTPFLFRKPLPSFLFHDRLPLVSMSAPPSLTQQQIRSFFLKILSPSPRPQTPHLPFKGRRFSFSSDVSKKGLPLCRRCPSIFSLRGFLSS